MLLLLHLQRVELDCVFKVKKLNAAKFEDLKARTNQEKSSSLSTNRPINNGPVQLNEIARR
jgi:hypothetical protein